MPELSVILLAEDGEDDILLMRRIFAKGRILNPLEIVRDGEEVIAYLSGQGKYANRSEYPIPGLLLLDLKMPRMDGFDVLRWLRADRGMSALRVVVLTGSDQIREVHLAYQLGANSFLVKPVDFERFITVTQAMDGYWVWMNKPPETFRASPNFAL